MDELNDTLLRMKSINSRMAGAANITANSRNSAIVSLRQEFSEECGHFLHGLQAILRTPRGPDLFIQLQTSFEAMRARLSSHQSKWSTAAISQNYGAYLDASKNVNARISDFVQECLDAIYQASRPMAD